MKNLLLLKLLLLIIVCSTKAQIQDVDLSQKKGVSINIKTGIKAVRLLNCSENFNYELDWKVVQAIAPAFSNAAFSSNNALSSCTPEVQKAISDLRSENDEEKVKTFVETARTLINKLGQGDCATLLRAEVTKTEQTMPVPLKVDFNQVITLTVTKVAKDSSRGESWSYTLKTPEKTRWIVHYGLTYAPALISKVDHYHAFADTSVASRYKITKDNGNGPKPWDNISATVNFTYPFHSESKGLDGGFTAGFGISPGLELSGLAGISLVVGDNVIITTGITMMQKYKLKGQYTEGQIVKENLDFDALHSKVWLPELCITLGFRFNSSPFNKKTPTTNSTATTSPE